MQSEMLLSIALLMLTVGPECWSANSELRECSDFEPLRTDTLRDDLIPLAVLKAADRPHTRGCKIDI
jgi:hypothetical protein